MVECTMPMVVVDLVELGETFAQGFAIGGMAVMLGLPAKAVLRGIAGVMGVRW